MLDRPLPVRLPADYSSFVGRRKESSDILQLLSRTRLLTLTGLGGVGKSRLALRAATKVRHVFSEGMCVVDVARLDAQSLLVDAITDAFGVENPDELGDRRVLVILDNCEYRREPCAMLVDELLGATGGLRVLATSREALHLAVEHVYPLAPLRVPDEATDLSTESGLRYSGLALFADRAAAVRPGFALTDVNVHVVADICRSLDGIPLAIELAAARLSTLSLAEIRSRLPRRFNLLTSGNRAVPRHQTLREVFDWSFSLCTEQEKVLWQRVSVFAGGFGLEAAERVCGEDGLGRHELAARLARLADKSVLMAEEPRYRMLDTVALYGLERLRNDENDVGNLDEAMLRTRHRAYYLDLAERFSADWFGPGQVAWLAHIRREHANLRAALASGLGVIDEEQSGLRLAAALHYFWWAGGGSAEGRRWLERALSSDRRPGAARMRALVAYGRLLNLTGNNAAAVEPVGECLKLAVRMGDVDCEADSRSLLGYSLALGYDASAGLPLLEQAVHVGHLAPMTQVLTRIRLVVGLLVHGDLTRAGRLALEATQICRAHRDRWLHALALDVSAMVALAKGNTAQARTDAREALRVRRTLNDATATSLEVLAWIAAADDDHRTAARLLGAADRHWQAVGGSPFTGAWSRMHAEAEHSAKTSPEFDAEFRRGKALSPGEAVAFALGETPLADGRTSLTPRQLDIMALIAEGLSSKQIAARLTLSSRTVESHVARILSVLDLSSRIQIAAWYAERERQA